MAEKFKWYRNLHGGNAAPSIEKFPVAGSQTLLRGDLVILSSGLVTVAGDAIADVLGIMAEDSTAQAEGTLVKVQVILPGHSYRATADAAATAAILTSRKIDINVTTQTVDIGDTTNGCITILRTLDSTTDVEIMFTEFALGAN